MTNNNGGGSGWSWNLFNRSSSSTPVSSGESSNDNLRINVKSVDPDLEEINSLSNKIKLTRQQISSKEKEKQDAQARFKEYVRRNQDSYANLELITIKRLEKEIQTMMTSIVKYEESIGTLNELRIMDDTTNTVKSTNRHVESFILKNEKEDMKDIILDDKQNVAQVNQLSRQFNLTFGASLNSASQSNNDEIARMRQLLQEEELASLSSASSSSHPKQPMIINNNNQYHEQPQQQKPNQKYSLLNDLL